METSFHYWALLRCDQRPLHAEDQKCKPETRRFHPQNNEAAGRRLPGNLRNSVVSATTTSQYGIGLWRRVALSIERSEGLHEN